MKRFFYIGFLFIFGIIEVHSQTQKTEIEATLIPEIDGLLIRQKIVYYNRSTTSLKTIVLHNWSNSFSGKKTPLSKRLIENHKKKLYFSDSISQGFSTIQEITVNSQKANFNFHKNKPDILEVPLEKELLPKDSIILSARYLVKIPSAAFTGYGKNRYGDYNLRFWYLSPAVFENSKWQAHSNLDMDHQYSNVSDYDMKIHVPIGYHVNSALNSKMSYQNHLTTFELSGKKRVDVKLNITKYKSYETIQTNTHSIVTDLNSPVLENKLQQNILNRSLNFIASHLGEYPHEKILIDKISHSKDELKIPGLSSIPKIFDNQSEVFLWDLQLFKALCKNHVENTLLFHNYEDSWLSEGLQTYLTMKYTSQYYPEKKLFGGISKIWGLRKFNFAQMTLNDKYPFIYQYTIRENIDQALTTQLDSLSNFNRTIVNKYKAGLGLRYLDEYLGDEILEKSILSFYKKNKFQKAKSNSFKAIVKKHTQKEIDWFFGEYIHTKKKIDYTLKKVKESNDSLYITLKNKRKITAPVALYGVKKKAIVWKRWITGVDSIKTIRIAKGDFDKISLNYEALYPEFNRRDNWKNVNPKLFERPLQFRFIKDVNNPYYNQVFYKPSFDYNYYDGVIFGLGLSNKSFLKKNFEYKIVPTYSTKSQTFSGKFAATYNYYPERTNIYRFSVGASGSSFHYAEDLTYRSFSPQMTLQFKRKNLRDTGKNEISLRYRMIDREIPENSIRSEEDNYNIVSLNYSFWRPEIIHDFQFNSGLELAGNFSKIITDIRYRKLTKNNRRFDFRWYTGVFITNNTDANSNYFSFGLSRPQDYLFRHNLFGRSEDTGFVSQQYVIADGGFKSFFKEDHQKFANEWMTTLNTSFGIYKSLEMYNDIGFLKSKGSSVFFAHESGFRLNFVHNILELYFPIHSNLGWEIGQNNYSSKIRFILTLDGSRIFNFVRRGFL